MRRTAYIGLGSNLGDRIAHLRAALRGLSLMEGVELDAVSPVYETEPVGDVVQGPFLNAAARVQTTLSADALLADLLALEAREGRVRDVRRGPRTLDLDLLLFGDEVRLDDGLTLPHPEMRRRGFVLEPLSDLAPEALLPGTGKPISVLRDDWRGGEPRHSETVRRIAETIWP